MTKRTSFPLHAEPIVELEKSLTLEGALRSKNGNAEWAGKDVFVYSGEHNAFWRPKGAGYTSYVDAAGVYKFETALGTTRHCDPSKRIMFYAVPLSFKRTSPAVQP